MKNKLKLLIPVLTLTLLPSCGANDEANTISICCSETPHAQILNNAVKPILKEKGYELNVTVLDWSIQNDGVYQGDYDANYFQHRPYLQQYDSNSSEYDVNYTYQKVMPVVGVHFEPLHVYEGKSSAADFESKKTTATYEICSDPSNEIRALDFLKSIGVIDSYEIDKSGNPINLPKNITPIDENMLVAQRQDYDYAILPCNTALTGNLTADPSLPVEGNDVADLRANVIACSVSKYTENETYQTKINALVDAVLDSSVSKYISTTWNNVIVPVQKAYIER